ncbi:MAG: aminodeoxychorismate synthase component I [Candidatus Omnitrophica bacterium]|nr:aminodeoxychorismate synthase component I [Candidatus Omnitrophota bacterium]
MNNTFIMFTDTFHSGETEALICGDPLEIITCHDAHLIKKSFDLIEKALKDGFFVCGFLSYELGYHFMEIPYKMKSDFPFLAFGVYPSIHKIPLSKLVHLLEKKSGGRSFSLKNQKYSLSCDEYCSDIDIIKDNLRSGNTYQVNQTFKYEFDFDGCEETFFNTLLERQHAPYTSFFEMDHSSIYSLSPELFFKRTNNEMLVKPMKGTLKRGETIDEDLNLEETLKNSAKDRSENIMIVDLLRNDLGKISKPGSVVTSDVFNIEKYSTLFQMTSSVKSILKDNISWHEIFKGIFPSGSVTGAPKKRTMEIIKDLEKSERKIYTGSMGYILPNGHSQFNICIRTVLMDNKTKKCELGIGSGIVIDSDGKKEYDECLLKGSFLTGATKDELSLIETLLWEDGNYFLVELHLKRLADSSLFFGFTFEEKKLKDLLDATAKSFKSSSKYKVRMLLNKDGSAELSYSILEKPVSDTVNIMLSDKKLLHDNFLLKHKTTSRRTYNEELLKYKDKNIFDHIFTNEKDELTEGCISNIILRKGGKHFTPPVSCGLLPGVYREYLLKTQPFHLEEKVLKIEHLRNADEIFVCNSVRKLQKAVLV